jgi:rare lipoprotein A
MPIAFVQQTKKSRFRAEPNQHFPICATWMSGILGQHRCPFIAAFGVHVARIKADDQTALCRNEKENVVNDKTGKMLLVAFAISVPQFFALHIVPASAESGVASVYSTESGGGTASGERLNPQALTAAHRTLPFGTKVRVTNKNNGRSVVVKINDRGPFVRGRVIDVTPAAARELGFSGLTQVTVNKAGDGDQVSQE